MAHDIEIGAVYDVRHQRKGRFMLRVSAVRDAGEKGDDWWIDGEIVDGTARAHLPENTRETGDDVTIRWSLCALHKLYCASVVPS